MVEAWHSSWKVFVTNIIFHTGHNFYLMSIYIHHYLCRVVIPDDNEYGSDVDGDGEFSGVVGQVQRQEVSIGAGQFSMTQDRMRVVSFSCSFGVEYLTILMRTPSPKSKNILDPFSPLGIKPINQS